LISNKKQLINQTNSSHIKRLKEKKECLEVNFESRSILRHVARRRRACACGCPSFSDVVRADSAAVNIERGPLGTDCAQPMLASWRHPV